VTELSYSVRRRSCALQAGLLPAWGNDAGQVSLIALTSRNLQTQSLDSSATPARLNHPPTCDATRMNVPHTKRTGGLDPDMLEPMLIEFQRAPELRARPPGGHCCDSALLMSDEGSYITGQVIGVDGGSNMRQ
jgi:hypothetical protein